MRDDGRATRPHDASRAQSIRIYLRHHNDPDGKFTPREVTCADYTDSRGHEQKGCGATVWRYLTYPNQKAMRFDGEPRIVPESTAVLSDGGVVAKVDTTNVHYATCSAKKPATPPVDFRTAAAGGL